MFQSDIYPPTTGLKPGVSAAEWFGGKTAAPPKISLESVYEGEAPKERRRRTLDAIKSESGERERAAWEEIEDVIRRLDVEDVQRRSMRSFVEGV
jgi:hypothetical protein